MTQLNLTLKMTTAQVVETSVTVNYNSPIQDYVHLDDHTQPTYEMTSGFKILTVFILCCSNSSRASPLKDNKRSKMVFIKKIKSPSPLKVWLKLFQRYKNDFHLWQ